MVVVVVVDVVVVVVVGDVEVVLVLVLVGVLVLVLVSIIIQVISFDNCHRKFWLQHEDGGVPVVTFIMSSKYYY